MYCHYVPPQCITTRCTATEHRTSSSMPRRRLYVIPPLRRRNPLALSFTTTPTAPAPRRRPRCLLPACGRVVGTWLAVGWEVVGRWLGDAGEVVAKRAAGMPTIAIYFGRNGKKGQFNYNLSIFSWPAVNTASVLGPIIAGSGKLPAGQGPNERRQRLNSSGTRGQVTTTRFKHI